MSLALWLRQGRAQRGMTVDDVAKVTKIQPRILESLEAGRFDCLPADVFVRGFVRSFARCVGLDEAEALKRYMACGRVDSVAPAAARAFVETMGELAPQAAGRAPVMLANDEPAPSTTAIEVIDASEFAEPAIEAPVRTAQGTDSSPTVVAPEAPAIEAAPAETGLLPSTGTLVDEEQPKKKRTRKKAAATGEPATRKRKTDEPGAEPKRRRKKAQTTIATTIVASGDALETTEPIPASASAAPLDTGASDMWSAEAAEAVADEVAAERVASSAWSGVELSSPPISPDTSAEMSAATSTDMPVATALDTSEPTEVDQTVGGTWTPRMPAPTATPPWRRPYATSTAPVIPSLVIDDADPESAERELEDRAAERTQTRRSFLPPILLDRDDRSARQGGLTLAVILLLIAATLTLSYLMRRPSSSGDGMTMRDVPTQLS